MQNIFLFRKLILSYAGKISEIDADKMVIKNERI
jgi:hypothetical protein